VRGGKKKKECLESLSRAKGAKNSIHIPNKLKEPSRAERGLGGRQGKPSKGLARRAQGENNRQTLESMSLDGGQFGNGGWNKTEPQEDKERNPAPWPGEGNGACEAKVSMGVVKRLSEKRGSGSLG